MSISGMSNMINTRFRLSGLATGLDTDQIISDLMRAERVPLDKIYQKKQLAEWKRDSYRDITNLLRGLKDEFFNTLKPSSNMLLQSTYKKFTSTSTDSAVVTVSGSSSAIPGAHTVKVTNLATADIAVSSSNVSKELTGSPTAYALSGKTINITLDGVTREIAMDDYTDLDNMINKAGTGLQALVDTEFGSGKIVVSNSGGQLKFETTGGSSRITLASGSTNDGLTDLGFTSGSSNRINTSDTLESLASKFAGGLTFDGSDNLVFTINSKQFTFSKTTSLSSMMSTINSDETAKVNITYDEASDKFMITAKQTGAGDNIKISQTGGTFFDGASKISTANPVTTEGEDAVALIDNQTITRSSNSFVLNGVTYTLLKESAVEQTVTLNQDVDGIYNSIKSFVDKYNEVIGKINEKLLEKYDRNYQPLTEEQKDAMKEDDVKKWEEKAKTGLLKNDRLLESIVTNMRKALFDDISGVSATLTSIGINTGLYAEKGKLTIDENKLKSAIQNDPDGVMNLFSKQSTTHPGSVRTLTAEQRTVRYQEEGLFYRLYDIVEDNISIYRDSNDKKGMLLEKAGITGDTSEYKNLIYEEIKDYDKRISAFNDRLIDKENAYYKKFAALERIMSEMNSQGAWLASQFG